MKEICLECLSINEPRPAQLLAIIRILSTSSLQLIVSMIALIFAPQVLLVSFFCLVFLPVQVYSAGPQHFESSFSTCPLSCSVTGSDPANWVYYHDEHALDSCTETSLLQLNVYNPVDDPNTHLTFRSCAVTQLNLNKRQALSSNVTAESPSANSCTNQVKAIEVTRDLQLFSYGTSTGSSSAPSALKALAAYLTQQDYCLPANTPTNLFVKSGSVIAGVYVGTQIQRQSVATIIEKLASSVPQGAQIALQLCNNRTTETFGLYLDTKGDLTTVQMALSQLNSAKCFNGTLQTGWKDTPVSIIPAGEISIKPSTGPTKRGLSFPELDRRATCTYIQAQSGDGCYSLAQACGISQTQLQNYNGGASFCNNIQLGQYVCCSAGTLPDFSPQPQPNGACTTYTVQSGDTCSAITNSHSMSVDQLNSRNAQTWGWVNCPTLFIGQVICLSTGTPPMPAPVSGAVCGPQVPGTAKPSDMSTLSGLNPCLLNACCDIWGQCGTTSDFCVNDPAASGAPGTALPNTNGCISNCGYNIVNNSTKPASFMRIGYYESFNLQRPCLTMQPSQINTSKYTHVHFAFAGVTTSFQVDISAVQTVFNSFKLVTGVKKILSFGGWSFSTSQDSYPIFRNGVTAANRQTFVTSVVNFVAANGLDGVDFDWEYPGAPDIPGTPPGSPTDGPNYLAFLQLLRQQLPAGKTISIAAPASYWYLKGFPIASMSSVVDYIVYMTYDLHGQWDYLNSFSDPGCPAGNCLRSHVNWTETMSAFSMITKAGVPTNKIAVGMALYGRSFQMTTPGCHTEMCTYTGPNSTATPGQCTETAGYIANAEINAIIASPARNPLQYSDPVSGNILVYDTTQWVAWMNPSTYASRLSQIQGFNFGGTSDWAMDLDGTINGPASSGSVVSSKTASGSSIIGSKTSSVISSAHASASSSGIVVSSAHSTAPNPSSLRSSPAASSAHSSAH
jgi:chitinase